MDYIHLRQRTTDDGQQLTIADVKEMLKDWIKLYPNSFAPDVNFRIYQLEDGDIIIRLHEDMSSMAAALLVLYLESTSRDSETQRRKVTEPTANIQQPTAYITIDDTEILPKQHLGKRAMIFSGLEIGCDEEIQQSTIARVLLDDNYYHEHDFNPKSLLEDGKYYRRSSLFDIGIGFGSEDKPEPQSRKDYYIQFEEIDFSLPDDYEIVKVGEIVKIKSKEIDESEDLTPNKMMWYLICGAVGLGIGFLIVYLTGM